MTPRVKNKRRHAWQDGDVYVGRPSPFGNPFPVTPGRTREQAIAQFEAWLLARPALVAKVKTELRGHNLTCWCAPLPCHADVLLRIANE